MEKLKLETVFISFFSACICLTSFIKIPFGVVPLVFQNIFCILTGIFIGGYKACLPCLIFLVAGLLGLPVYSGGSSGLSVWIGPTGGFLPGYFFASLIAGLIVGKARIKKVNSRSENFKIFLALFLGMIIIYIPGIIHFARFNFDNSTSISSALKISFGLCVLPFLPGDIFKLFIGFFLAKKIRPLVANYLDREKNEFNKI